jgi:hypothetical protein
MQEEALGMDDVGIPKPPPGPSEMRIWVNTFVTLNMS